MGEGKGRKDKGKGKVHSIDTGRKRAFPVFHFNPHFPSFLRFPFPFLFSFASVSPLHPNLSFFLTNFILFPPFFLNSSYEEVQPGAAHWFNEVALRNSKLYIACDN